MRTALRPSMLYRSDRPRELPAMSALLALNAACVLLLLAALSPFLAVSGLFAGAVCLVAVRNS
ncbi:hypothetical protein HWV23_04395 [Natronomonas halophila]|nr:hypothetical protein HWV23_04395 [Natronomonas halophila]